MKFRNTNYRGGGNINFNYDRLRERIEEVYGSQERFCTKFGLKRSELKQKLENRAEFTQREINRCCALLAIGGQEITTYFFTEKSSESRTLALSAKCSAEWEYIAKGGRSRNRPALSGSQNKFTIASHK
jgi:hypothetical protein